jgi:hypothetical protein
MVSRVLYKLMSYVINCSIDDEAVKSTSKISSRLFDIQDPKIGSKRRNIEAKLNISILNSDTLEEYEGETKFNVDFMPKLNHWISKKRYRITDE